MRRLVRLALRASNKGSESNTAVQGTSLSGSSLGPEDTNDDAFVTRFVGGVEETQWQTNLDIASAHGIEPAFQFRDINSAEPWHSGRQAGRRDQSPDVPSLFCGCLRVCERPEPGSVI